MKQLPESPLTFAMTPWDKTYQEDGAAVLAASATLPCFSGGTRQAQSRLNRFYQHMSLCFRRQAARLARQAGAERRAARSRSRWFAPWQCALSAEVRLEEDALLVTWQAQDARGVAFSGAERWHLPEGTLEGP